ncbi:permease [Streptomyces abikoensis]
MTDSPEKPEPDKNDQPEPGKEAAEKAAAATPEPTAGEKPAEDEKPAEKAAEKAAAEPAEKKADEKKASEDKASEDKADEGKAAEKKTDEEKPAAAEPDLVKKDAPAAKKDDPADDPAPASSSPSPASVVPQAIKAIPVRHYGRWISAVVVLAILGLLLNAFASANVHYSAIPDYLFDSTVVTGLGKTVLISLLAMLLGLVLGIVLAVMRLSKNPVTSSVSWLYIWFFRGTPVYVQLLLWFNLALIFPYINLGPIYRDEMSDFMTPFMAALLGLGLNEAAYMSEIVRAGIQSVDEGQTEAAHALGMSQGKTLRRIVLPQAMRVIVPPTGNEFINMLKTSSLAASAAQYLELLRSTSDIGQTTGATVEMLFLAATWYLILTSVFSVGQFYLERHYARGSLRTLPLTPWQKVKKNLSTLGQRSKEGVSA